MTNSGSIRKHRDREPGLGRFTVLSSWALLAIVAGWTFLFTAPAFAATDAPASADEFAFFEKRIRPVLVERCYECHSVESGKAKGGLRVDSRDALRRGGETRPAIVPGDVDKSLLIEAIRYANQDMKMPPKGRLSESVVADFETWVRMNAPDPRDEAPALAAAGPSAPSRVTTNHWAFEPPHAVTPPQVKRAKWVRSPIDAFVLAKLEAAKLSPAPAAEKATLLRRVTFDLIGLPPTPEEVDAFVADKSPDAFAKVVERLLASPHYGERWGRHWLDVARYADSNGQDENKAMSHAWRYRDYVIDAFNRDKPYDQFIREQLAGDLLPPAESERETFDQWTATGFLVLGPKMLAEQDKPKLVMDVVDEQIDVVSRAFLGLTVSCSRCHDHKFDPVPARDYYALAGIFKSTKTMADLAFVSKWNERPVATKEETARFDAYVTRTNEVERAIAKTKRDADAAVAGIWRSRAGDYLQSAAECLPKSAGSIDTNAVDSVVRKRGLHRGTLDRWLAHLSQCRTNGGSPLAKYLSTAGDTNAFASVVQQLAEMQSTLTPTAMRFGLGKIGSGLRCDGANYVEAAHAAELEPASLTVEAWVRLEEQSKDGDARRWVVNKNANEWAEGHYALMLDGRWAGAYLNIGGGPENVFAVWSDAGALPLREWRHVAFTYDGADLRLFVNGEAAGVTHIGRKRVPGVGALHIGRRQDGYNYFTGGVDEVRLYRRALSAEEIRRRQSDPGSEVADGLVRRWSFEPTIDAERTALAQEQQRELLFGAEGLLVPPKESRPFYPADSLARLDTFKDERAVLRTNAPPAPAIALAVEEAAAVDLPIHIRGSHLNLAKDSVPRGFVQVLNRITPPAIPQKQSGRRQLAEWLTQPEHPLTARVMVNRIWQAHFGEGLVRTPDNFGLRGEAPSHPELLDWLAREFVRGGWSVKQLHRLILLSSTYQMSVAFNARAANVDPENRLLWRMNRRRLEAESLRDALLAVSGQLDRTMGGSLVNWQNADYTPGDSVSATARRRAVYLPVVRDRVYDLFTIFDFANPSVGVSKRTPTVVSHQALFFLNSPLVKEQSRHLANSLLAVTDTDDTARVHDAYRRVLGRSAQKAEVNRALHYLAQARSKLPASAVDASTQAWASLCQAMLASNEFLYLD